MQRLETVLKFLKEKGKRVNGTRVEDYQKIVTRFLNKPELTDDEAWALVELHELYVIIHGAKKNERIDEGLQRCLRGVRFLEQEQVANSGNAPRNASFELFVASKMTIFGSTLSIPPFGKSADITFSCAGQMVPIECKRLYATGKVSKILQETCSQVSKRLDDGKYGIAAISLTREFWSSISSSVMGSADEARQAVEELYQRWRSETFRILMAYPKVALIYIHIQIPCMGEEQVFYVYERGFFRTRVNYENLPEAPIVNEFTEMLTSDGVMNAIARQW